MNTGPKNYKRRAERLDALRAILSIRKAATQKDLLAELNVAGFKLSQPMLVNDLQTLHAGKVKTREGYQYVLPQHTSYTRPLPTPLLSDYLKIAGIERIAFANHLLVLHTRDGYATGMAADIDAHNLSEIAGTIAGYNTIFIAPTEGVDKAQLIEALSLIIPAIRSVL